MHAVLPGYASFPLPEHHILPVPAAALPAEADTRCSQSQKVPAHKLPGQTICPLPHKHPSAHPTHPDNVIRRE